MNEQEIRQKWKVLEKPDQKKPGFMGRHLVVEILVEILNNQSGIIHNFTFEAHMEEGETHPSPFNWKENNFSCDCNRHLFFYRAIGEELEEKEEDDECTEWKYSVKLINPVDGKAYYNEFAFNDLLK